VGLLYQLWYGFCIRYKDRRFISHNIRKEITYLPQKYPVSQQRAPNFPCTGLIMPGEMLLLTSNHKRLGEWLIAVETNRPRCLNYKLEDDYDNFDDYDVKAMELGVD
jgi:hypothetical protein